MTAPKKPEDVEKQLTTPPTPKDAPADTWSDLFFLHEPEQSADPIAVKSPKRTYTLRNLLAAGDVADVYLATAAETAYILKISRIPEGVALLENEKAALALLLTAAGDTTYRKYFPTLAESFRGRDTIDKRVNVVLYEPGLHTLEQVKAKYPDGLEGRHLAWIYKRLLTALGFLHRQGLVHGAILPCHVLIHAESHGLQFVGWGHSVEAGQAITTISAAYRDWYPPEVLQKRPASLETDLYLAARCMVYLAGGDPLTHCMPEAVPAVMQRFFKASLLEGQTMRPEDAWALHEDFDELLRGLYGPPRFIKLPM
ncbi:MAG TPA: serine/threonine-protein kinase [Gemmataceae bacterium]|nr:serine/threonine-protein kinase [Gemmataceae bacterium]